VSVVDAVSIVFELSYNFLNLLHDLYV